LIVASRTRVHTKPKPEKERVKTERERERERENKEIRKTLQKLDLGAGRLLDMGIKFAAY